MLQQHLLKQGIYQNCAEMGDIITVINARRNLFKGAPKDLDKLIKKLESVSHAPTSEKHTKRMKPFAKNNDLLQFVNNLLQQYYQNSNRFRKDKSGFTTYDVKNTWYLFTILLYSSDVENSISLIIANMIESRNPDLDIVRRLLNLCTNPIYSNHLQQVEAFFTELNKNTAVYQWMNSLDVTPPQVFDWEFTIRLGTKPIVNTSNEFTDNLYLTLIGKEPKGDGSSFRIELIDRERSISSRWDDFSNDDFIFYKNQKLKLSSVPSLQNLRQVIIEVEGLFGLEFERKYRFQYFTRGFKNKNNIQKWLEKPVDSSKL